MKAKKAFLEVTSICYEEDEFTELHKEILSIENGIQPGNDEEEYIRAVGEVLDAICTFAPDFNQEKYYHIEEIYGEISEQN